MVTTVVSVGIPLLRYNFGQNRFLQFCFQPSSGGGIVPNVVKGAKPLRIVYKSLKTSLGLDESRSLCFKMELETPHTEKLHIHAAYHNWWWEISFRCKQFKNREKKNLQLWSNLEMQQMISIKWKTQAKNNERNLKYWNYILLLELKHIQIYHLGWRWTENTKRKNYYKSWRQKLHKSQSYWQKKRCPC